jgi:uncharacterized membrane protein
LGVWFRLTHLGSQVYWHDEAYTSLRISGHTSIEVNQALFRGEVVGVEALQPYQQVHAEKTMGDTVRSLAIEDAQHPPLYYVMVRQWALWFGSSIAAIRSLSAVISLLLFPCIYWFYQELCASQPPSRSIPHPGWVAGVAIALIAVSPFHVLYAQEARQYALWSVLIVGASAAFLRALRLNTGVSWGGYMLMLILSLYTHPLSLLVAIAHGIYLLGIGGWRTSRGYLMAVALSIIAFSPWLKYILQTWSRTGVNWTSVPLPLVTLLKTWGLHLVRIFLLTAGDFGFDQISVYVSLPLLLLLIVYGVYFLCSHTPRRIWLFLVVHSASTALPLSLADLILGGQRSVGSRYLMPIYLGIPLILAYLLAHHLLSPALNQRRLWQGVTGGLLAVGIVACGLNYNADTAWNKIVNYNLPTVIRIVNTASTPLLVGNSGNINFGTLLALSHYLDPKVKLQLLDGHWEAKRQSLPNPPMGFGEIFLLNPSEALQQKWTARGQKLVLRFRDSHLFLWQLLP